MSSHGVSVRKDTKMAKVYSREGKLYIDYEVNGVRKRKSTKLDDTKQNRSLVEKNIIPNLMRMIATGEIFKKKPKTFDHYFCEFLKRKSNLSSYDSKLQQWKRINLHFGNIDIDRITRHDIKSYLIDMPILSSSKGVFKSALVEIFDIAIDDRVIEVNPALNIKLKSDDKKEVDYFTKEEVNLLLSKAKGVLFPYLLLAFNTGMRPEEILGLQIGDIQNSMIDIKRVRTKGKVKHPKTRNSIRRIPCPDFVIKEVLKLKSNHIFLFGDLYDVHRLHYPWWNLLKECGFGIRKIYSCRHTFATIMLQDSIVSINELAGLLGHSTPKITLTHYASVIDSKTIDLGINFDLYGTISTQSNNRRSANTDHSGV